LATARLDIVFQHLRRVVMLRDGAGMTDGQLLESFVSQRSEVAFEALVRRHGPMVLKVCRRALRNHHDAEDAFQATFLVLARKASSVRPRDMVANWLYGVAYRTALKARTLRAKAQTRERHVRELPEPAHVQRGRCHDLQEVLDQELTHLGDTYRLPIILCDLEGKSIKKTAEQLGWPPGTVAGRLARGRKLLAKRLARHGLAMVGGVGIVANSASACVPPALVAATVKAVGACAAGQAVATGVMSANVAVLMEGALKAMFLTKLKTVAALLLVAVTAGIGGGILSRSTTAAAQTAGDHRGDQPQPKATRDHQTTDSGIVPGTGKAGKNAEATQTDLDRMQGIWSVVSIEQGGKPDKFEKTVFMVDGKRACIQTSSDEKDDIRGGLYLDQTSEPKTFDLAMHKETREGIYLLEGDTLRLCYELGEDAKRPTRFTTEPGSKQVLVVLKRMYGREIFPYRRADGSRTFPQIIEPAVAEPVQPPPPPRVPKESGLVIDNACFCEKITSFGFYEPLPEGHVFRISQSEDTREMVRLYAEVRNFASELKNGYHVTRIASLLEIRDQKDVLVWSSSFGDEKPIRSRTMLHDFCKNYVFYLPNSLAAGTYTLVIRVTDQTRPEQPRVAKKALELRVGASQEAVATSVQLPKPRVPTVPPLVPLAGKSGNAVKSKEKSSGTVGQIIISGCDSIADALIRQEVLRMYPGQVFDADALRKAEKRLSELDTDFITTITVLEGQNKEVKDILVTVKEKELPSAKNMEDDFLAKLSGGYLDLKTANYEIWVQEVKGRSLIRPILVRRGSQGRNDLVAMGDEAELKVDLEKGILQLIMSKAVTISTDGDRGSMETRSWSIPLASIEGARPVQP
jgi:RNA polymerase sigma factor (sigma-70 family)